MIIEPAGELAAALTGAAGVDTLMAGLRSWALGLDQGTDWSRCDDHQVIAYLETAGVQAEALRPASTLYRIAVPAAARAAPSPPPSSGSTARREAAAASAAPPESVAGALSPQLDAAALVAVLQEAARDGVPFCEECERARRRKRA